MDTLIAQDGATIHYHTLGSQGSPVIFLHGWTSSSQEWLPYAEPLAEHHRVFCWDARGHGAHYQNNAHPAPDCRIQLMAQDLHQLIEQHQLQNVVLVGHSMGALTCWHYIREYGTKTLAGLCIIDQSPKLETDQQWQMGVYSNFNAQRNQQFIEQLQENFAAGVLKLIGEGHNRRSQDNYQNNSRGFQKMYTYLQSLPAAALTRCWQSLSQEDYRAVLPIIDVPALLIYGDESQFYSEQLACWVAGQIPNSELHIYEGSDHSPHMWHPQRFRQQLAKFIALTGR